MRWVRTLKNFASIRADLGPSHPAAARIGPGVITLWSALAVTWLLLSGHYTPLLLALGIAASTLVVWLASRMGVTASAELLRLVPRSAPYVVYLLFQIARASLDVIRRVVDPRLPVSPTLVEVRASQRTDAWRVVYANSITLTPGTISVELSGQSLRVHALTRGGAGALATGDLDRRVAALDIG